MELEELKSIWNDMSEQMDRQKKLTHEIILKMAHEKSSSRVKRIVYMEGIGVAITVVGLAYLLFNFSKLKDWLSITGGVGISIVAVVSIVLGANIILKAKKIDVIQHSYARVLENFNALRRILGIYKWVSICFYIVMPFLLAPVFVALTEGESLLNKPDKFKEILVASFLILPVVLFIIFRIYRGNMRKISKAISEINTIEN